MNHPARRHIRWRWAERDLGFRFRQGKGKKAADYHQAAQMNEFYHVPDRRPELGLSRLIELAAQAAIPTAPTIVAVPWRNYTDPDCQMVAEDGGVCLNWAGCLNQEEINLRETNGVNRAKEFIAELAAREEPVPIALDLIQKIHTGIFGDIYPWTGKWCSVTLSKGDVKYPEELWPVMKS